MNLKSMQSNVYRYVSNQAARLYAFMCNSKELVYGLMLYIACRPELANAGILSKGLCKPYKQLVDNELFMVVAAIAAVILVIAWKLAPSGGAMAKGVGLLAALVIGLNIENILQVVAGVGLAC
jgi:dipeptide/tripeptide permease